MGVYAFHPDPDEIRKYLDRQQADATETYLRIYSVFESFTIEQLDVVLDLLTRATSQPEFGHHITGVLYGVRRYHLGLCGCAGPNGDHTVADHSDPEFLMKFGQADAEPDFPEEGTTLDDDISHGVLPESTSEPTIFLKNHRGEKWSGPLSVAMKDYNLEWYETGQSGGASGEVKIRAPRCISCKQEYVSIQDRALEKPGPEGCHGCVQQAKWGGGDPWNEKS